MLQLILPIIYLAFISLGLPDSLLGSAWPSMYENLQVSISYAGLITMIIAGGTILSSLLSERWIRRFGTFLVTLFSIFLTALALFGFSISNQFWHLCLWAIPYGLGAGSVDVALNNFVALHYKSRHMSWLHSFWGVGATVGPFIMSAGLTAGASWNTGYRIVGSVQICIALLFLLSLPLWKKTGNASESSPFLLRKKPSYRKNSSASRCKIRVDGVFLLLCAGSHCRPLGRQLYGFFPGNGQSDGCSFCLLFLHWHYRRTFSGWFCF